MKINEYVRTPKGIAKIETIEEDRSEIYFKCDTGLSISFIKKDFTKEEIDDFYKHSSNITDLVEENDYIRIITSAKFDHVYYFYGKLVIRDDIPIENYDNNFIAEVITREQIEQVSYKVVK